MHKACVYAWVSGAAFLVAVTSSGCDAKRLVKERHVARGEPPGPFEVGGMAGEPAARKVAPGAERQAANHARVQMKPTQGHAVQGELELTAEQGKVHIRGQLSGFQGAGEHGFHVHEVGNCQSPDAKSAGEHFSAMPHPHGGPTADLSARHTGDLGNVTSDANGNAQVDVWADVPLLTPGPEYAVGRAVIVHASADDLKGQPSGNAGARVACGVIESPKL